MKLIYPAYFKKNKHAYTVSIPDLGIKKYVGSGGLNYVMEQITQEACAFIVKFTEDGADIPQATDVNEMDVSENTGFLSYIVLDMDEYTRKYAKKSVKKTLTIPSWLNILAEESNINFSRVLQKALKGELQKYEAPEVYYDPRYSANEF
jgi:hypothetical protein